MAAMNERYGVRFMGISGLDQMVALLIIDEVVHTSTLQFLRDL